MKINEIAKEIHDINISKGFWDKENWNFGEKIALIHSELSETLEAHRDDRRANVPCFEAMEDRWERSPGDAFSFKSNIKNTVEDELADVCIRVFDLCTKMNIDLEKHIRLKVDYNKLRPRLHGKQY